ncbi:MAG: hypothetical protein Q8Q09_22820 [Deltaproteobacteria bacterium]|nr:hypothetical protein [Deltaproteobacteria bacterium]
MKRSAVAVLGAGLLLCSVVASAQDLATVAQQRFLNGLAHFDARRFDAALEDFRGSYAIRSSPNSRLYIARALRELGRMTEAVTEFETTVQEAREHAQSDPRYRETQTAATQELAGIEPRVGRLRILLVTPPEGASVQIAQRVIPVAALALPIAMDPGEHTVVVSSPGVPAQSQQVTIVAAGTHALRFEFAPLVIAPPVLLPAPERDYRVLPWLAQGHGPVRVLAFAALGVGLVGTLASVGLGAAAQGQYSALQARCSNTVCPLAEAPVIDSGRTLQTAANAMLVVGLVGLAAGVTLSIVGPRMGTERATVVALGAGSVHWMGAF